MAKCDFEANQTKVMGGCQSGRKVVPHDSKSDLPLVVYGSLREFRKVQLSWKSGKIDQEILRPKTA